ncbi:hypothetical protein SDC9_96215 [bioreactor metagenome]|uniref:Uncharacterized protein n=1 Tax=bioreactor metagenome TaxID=1076179 RepID=A0A645A8H0_9ZZZZ
MDMMKTLLGVPSGITLPEVWDRFFGSGVGLGVGSGVAVGVGVGAMVTVTASSVGAGVAAGCAGAAEQPLNSVAKASMPATAALSRPVRFDAYGVIVSRPFGMIYKLISRCSAFASQRQGREEESESRPARR